MGKQECFKFLKTWPLFAERVTNCRAFQRLVNQGRFSPLSPLFKRGFSHISANTFPEKVFATLVPHIFSPPPFEKPLLKAPVKRTFFLSPSIFFPIAIWKGKPHSISRFNRGKKPSKRNTYSRLPKNAFFYKKTAYVTNFKHSIFLIQA